MFPLRLLPILNCTSSSACVCVFPAHAGWCHVSHAGFLFHSDFGDFHCNRNAAMQSAPLAVAVWNLIKVCVLRDLGGCSLHAQNREQSSVKEQTLQAYGQHGQSRKSRGHEHSQRRHVVSLQVSCRRGAQPECVFSACACLIPAFGDWCHVSRTGFLTHCDYADIFQSNGGTSTQCAQPTLAVWNLTEGCVCRDQEGGGLHVRVREQESVMEKEQTYEQQGRNRKCRDHEQSSPSLLHTWLLRGEDCRKNRCAISRTSSSEDER